MFNPLNLFSKLIKSGNQKELDRIQKIVQKINLLEKDTEKLEEKEFPEKTNTLIGHRQIFVASMGEGKTVIEKQKKGKAAQEIAELSSEIY